LSLTEIVQAVRAVQQVMEGAKKRISPALKKVQKRTGVTFYSRLDFWEYDAVFDNRLCSQCANHVKTGVFAGSDLRSIFPYHTILDVNTIGGPEPNGDGLVHPHCRCRLRRKLEKEED
jgi:hypothetical protein